MKARDYKAAHFLWSLDDGGVATLTLNRPERKNPLTFESYAEMRDLFRALVHADDCKVVIVTGAGGNFSSGGDVHEIIGPLTEMAMQKLGATLRRVQEPFQPVSPVHLHQHGPDCSHEAPADIPQEEPAQPASGDGPF